MAAEEAEPGITALACPITDLASDTVLGTISIAGPSFRLPSERYASLSRELGKAALQIARILPHRVKQSTKKAAQNVKN